MRKLLLTISLIFLAWPAASQMRQTTAVAPVPNASLDSTSVTLQGNTFNAASRLVQLDAAAALPGSVKTSTASLLSGQKWLPAQLPSTAAYANIDNDFPVPQTFKSSVTVNGAFAWNGDATMKADTIISRNTSDGADSGYVFIAGGGSSGQDRGSYILLTGNEQGNLGTLDLFPGSSGVIRAFDAAATLMMTVSTGSVRIGGAAPAAALTVKSTSTAITQMALDLKDGNGGSVWSFAPNYGAMVQTCVTVSLLRTTVPLVHSGRATILLGCDWDFYISTGTEANQWRNMRTGIGP